jgi:hypothetical protein
MADKVVIVGLRRGGVVVPSNEIKQMMGRSGRRHEGEGLVELVVDKKDEGRIYDMLSEGSMSVSSCFTNPDMLAMSLMPEIDRGIIDSYESAVVWCSRCFCPNPEVEKAINLLKEVNAIKEDANGILKSTPIGSCASKFYFHPADVFAWWENFTHLFGMGLENDAVSPAWALGNVPFERIIGDLGERREIATECKSRLPLGIEAIKGSLINVITWWYLMGGPSPGALRLPSLERRRGFGRYKSALNFLNKHAGWNMEDFFDDLELRVSKGIVPELLPLCKLQGINKSRALYLFDLGVKCADDFESLSLEDIDDDFQESIRKIAKRNSTKSN